MFMVLPYEENSFTADMMDIGLNFCFFSFS